MAFKYRGRSEKTVNERANQQGGAFDNFIKSAIPRYKVKDHENNIRILPPTWADTDKFGENWGIELAVHYGIGADEATYLCPAKMLNKDCVICDARADAPPLEEGEKDELKIGKRIIAYLIDRDDEKIGPQVWAMPWTFERDVQRLSQDKKEGALMIDHPDDGYDLSFSRDGKGRNVKYVGIKLDRTPSAISDNPKTQKAWLDFIEENPLDEQLHYYDNDYISKVFRGQSSRRDEPEGSEAASAPTGRGARRSRDESDAKGKEETSSRRGGDAKAAKKPEKAEKALPSLDDVEDMDEDDLKGVIADHDLDIDPDGYSRVSKLKAAVIDAIETLAKGSSKKPAEGEDDDGETPPADAPDPKAGKKRAAAEPEDELPTVDDLNDMDERALCKVIKAHDLDVDPDEYPRESKLRDAVADALEALAKKSGGKKESATETARGRLDKLKEERKPVEKPADKPRRSQR